MIDNVPGVTDDELLDAWSELHAATPAGWIVCRPTFDERRDEWAIYAFDANERPVVGHRAFEWTAIAPTQYRAVRELARCLRILGAGGAPR